MHGVSVKWCLFVLPKELTVIVPPAVEFDPKPASPRALKERLITLRKQTAGPGKVRNSAKGMAGGVRAAAPSPDYKVPESRTSVIRRGGKPERSLNAHLGGAFVVDDNSIKVEDGQYEMTERYVESDEIPSRRTPDVAPTPCQHSGTSQLRNGLSTPSKTPRKFSSSKGNPRRKRGAMDSNEEPEFEGSDTDTDDESRVMNPSHPRRMSSRGITITSYCLDSDDDAKESNDDAYNPTVDATRTSKKRRRRSWDSYDD